MAFGEIDAIQKSSGITDKEDVEKIQIAAKTALQEKLRNAPIEDLESNQDLSEEKEGDEGEES